MKSIRFEIAGESIKCKELTVGQMRKAKELMKEDEFEAGLLMVKLSTGLTDEWLDKQAMSDLEQIGEWLGNPTD